MTSLRLSSLLLVSSALCACSDPINTTPVRDAATADVRGMDASAPVDAAVDVLATEVVIDSGCPAPAVLSPAQIPPRYLMPRVVRLIRTVDGDTAHFTYPVLGDVTVRFLYLNTEESHGDETTAFGVRTAEIVTGYLQSAREFTLAVRESTRQAGMPDTDTFGRWLGLVFADGELFQTRVVREGLSAYFTEFGCAPEPLHTTLLNAEAEARANHRGIWAPGHPTNYATVFARWFGSDRCRPNPFRDQPYCSR